MKFRHQDYAGRNTGPYTAEEAVAKELERCACDDGQLERLQSKLEALQGIVARLIDEMPAPTKAHAQRLADVIGSQRYLEEY